MEHILAQAKKVSEQADIFVVTSEETPLQFEANRLKHAQSKQGTLVAVRVVRKRAGESLAPGSQGVTDYLATMGGLETTTMETGHYIGCPLRFDETAA